MHSRTVLRRKSRTVLYSVSEKRWESTRTSRTGLSKRWGYSTLLQCTFPARILPEHGMHTGRPCVYTARCVSSALLRRFWTGVRVFSGVEEKRGVEEQRPLLDTQRSFKDCFTLFWEKEAKRRLLTSRYKTPPFNSSSPRIEVFPCFKTVLLRINDSFRPVLPKEQQKRAVLTVQDSAEPPLKQAWMSLELLNVVNSVQNCRKASNPVKSQEVTPRAGPQEKA